MATESKVFSVQDGKNTLLLKQNAKQQEKIYSEMIARQTSAVEKQILQRFRLEMQLQQDISKLESKALSDRLSDAEKEELKNKRKSLLRLSKVEGEDRKRATAAFKKSLEAAQTYELNFYKKLSVEKRKEYDKSTRAELDSERKLLKEKEQMLLAQIATETDQKKKTKLQKDLSEITSAKKQATDNIMSIDKRTKKGFSDASHEDANKRAESAKATKAEAKANIDRIVSSEKYIKIQQRIDQATAAGDRKKLNRAKSDLERFKKLEGYYASEADLEEANHELEMAHQEEVAATTKDNLNNLKNADLTANATGSRSVNIIDLCTLRAIAIDLNRIAKKRHINVFNIIRIDPERNIHRSLKHRCVRGIDPYCRVSRIRSVRVGSKCIAKNVGKVNYRNMPLSVNDIVVKIKSYTAGFGCERLNLYFEGSHFKICGNSVLKYHILARYRVCVRLGANRNRTPYRTGTVLSVAKGNIAVAGIVRLVL